MGNARTAAGNANPPKRKPISVSYTHLDVYKRQALNNYVALHYKAVHMNLLHCFYGIGVSLSPGLMSAALSGAGGWRAGYRTVACIQGAIAVIALASLPLWKKAASGDNGREEEPTAGLTLGEQMRMAKLRAVWLMFFGSCALEYTAGIWGSTFLVNCRGMAVEAAACLLYTSRCV